MLRWIERIEEAIDEELLPADLQSKFVMNSLLRGDSKARAEFYTKGRQWGYLSADDVRELEDLPPRGVPDDFLTAQNMERITIPALKARDARSGLAETVEMLLSAGQERASLPAPQSEIKCPKCDKLVAREVAAGGQVYCWRCKLEFTISQT